MLPDPDHPDNLLIYFAAQSGKEDYRILLAEILVEKISDLTAYKMLRDYDHAVLQRLHAKANYPYGQYHQEKKIYELWYSGQSIGNKDKRSCFLSTSKNKYRFEPSLEAIIKPSDDSSRNDYAYSTGPKIYGNDLYSDLRT
ncbi:MAG: hypothetical protein HC819_23490 [Cyclobacteriaceae bacterium]|nr:hypothetical protein [Cyclobacteriaceae bacterium]